MNIASRSYVVRQSQLYAEIYGAPIYAVPIGTGSRPAYKVPSAALLGNRKFKRSFYRTNSSPPYPAPFVLHVWEKKNETFVFRKRKIAQLSPAALVPLIKFVLSGHASSPTPQRFLNIAPRWVRKGKEVPSRNSFGASSGNYASFEIPIFIVSAAQNKRN